jgi:hypothetical protein
MFTQDDLLIPTKFMSESKRTRVKAVNTIGEANIALK